MYLSNHFSPNIFIVCCFYSLWGRCFVLSSKNNPLNGQHLRVIWVIKTTVFKKNLTLIVDLLFLYFS
jgi:hypothetical protein